MDFSNAGATEPAGAGFRAHVTWYDKGSNRNIYGPNRKDQVAAKEYLESMRAAAVTGGRYRRPSVVGGTVAVPFQD